MKEVGPGGARIIVEWGNDDHEIILTARDWTRVKRGGELSRRARGFSEEGFQWEYWHFAGGMDGKLNVYYGSDGGHGFDGKLADATIVEG
jgi:hypothetical protein